jgi:hypothetical protein
MLNCSEVQVFVSAAKAPAELRLWDFVAEHRKRIFHMLEA